MVQNRSAALEALQFHREQAVLLRLKGKSLPPECNAKLLNILFLVHVDSLLNLAPFLICLKKGANLLVRHDQQIDAPNFVYSIGRKIAPFLKVAVSKRAPHGFGFANH